MGRQFSGTSRCLRVALAYDGGVFLTPPVNGWILICGTRLPPQSEDAATEVETRLEILSHEFSDAQVFATHRVVEYHVWGRARDGSLTRGFGHLGEAGVTFWDTGFDEGEDALGFDFVDWSDDPSEEELDAADWPSEDHVMQVASAWSVAPVDFGGFAQIDNQPFLSGEGQRSATETQ